jgi:hypothetical protein
LDEINYLFVFLVSREEKEKGKCVFFRSPVALSPDMAYAVIQVLP